MDFVKLSDQTPNYQVQHNMRICLFNSPFNVFIDGGPTGHVFGPYSPL